MDLPIKNGGSFHSYVNVYQRVNEVSPRIGFQLFYLWLGGAKHVFFVQQKLEVLTLAWTKRSWTEEVSTDQDISMN